MSEDLNVSSVAESQSPAVVPAGRAEQTPSPLLSSLSRQQRQVLQVISVGDSIALAAAHARVCRTTVYRWLRTDVAFRAAYSAWQQEVLNSAQSRLLEALDDAVTTIRDAVAEGNTELAMKLIQGFSALRRPEPNPMEDAYLLREAFLSGAQSDVASVKDGSVQPETPAPEPAAPTPALPAATRP